MGNIPYGYCQCGCGQETRLAPYTFAGREWIRGEPQRYVWGHNRGTKPYTHKPIPIPAEKVCKGCGVLLSNTAEHFGLQKTGRGGLNPRCKECVRAYRREWRQTNPDKTKNSRQRYAQAHPERVRQTKRSSYEANAEKWVTWVRNRRALIANAEGTHTTEEIGQMYADQRGRCAYCECELDGSYQVDHMAPVSRGGRNDWANLAIVCGPCNNRKHTRTVEEFVGA